jgi:hypothetical protein
MNLFDMIFRNSKSKEVVFSSVYNYLLDRFETHGLGPVILERIIESLPNEAARQMLSVTGLEMQNTEAEYSLQEIGQIDSMIELSRKDGSKYAYLFTEVKIIDASARNTTRHGSQVSRYVEYIHKNISEDAVFLYLVPDTHSTAALGEFSSFLKEAPASLAEKSFVMFWRDIQSTDSPVPESNVCRSSFEAILRDVLQDEITGKIPPISTEMRYVLKSLINTVHNNFSREEIVYSQGRFPNRSEFLNRLPEVHKHLFEYLETKSIGRCNISSTKTSIGFPYTDNADGNPNTLFRVLTMKNYRRTTEDIQETDYADVLIIEINENIWALDDAMKDHLAEMFKGIAHVAFHQYHPNGRNNEKATWILFKDSLVMEDLPRAKKQIDTFWDLAQEQFSGFLETSA